MKEKLKDFWQKCKERFAEVYLYYVQGIEIGPRIERKMQKFQAKIQRMMKSKGITLIVTKNPDGSVYISFVPEKEFTEQKQIVDDLIAGEGDKLN